MTTMEHTPKPSPGEGDQPGSGDGALGFVDIVRGCCAVVLLFLTALDALVTALLGIAPLTPRLREMRHVISDEYQAGAHGWINAEVFDDCIGGT
jgi:hypothetical protein